MLTTHLLAPRLQMGWSYTSYFPLSLHRHLMWVTFTYTMIQSQYFIFYSAVRINLDFLWLL
jgi:hypothetical protein